jgi:iron complex outermembrane receptor protein
MDKKTAGFAAASAFLAFGAVPGVHAQSANAPAADDTLEEVVVTGTRRLGRTVDSSPAPIDVFNTEDFVAQGSNDMNDMLRTLVPSYNVTRFPISDAATVVRPATLRGLPPDSTLVLVNGKRRHRSSVIAELGGISAGSQGPDISVIPALALDRVEVLRDGAAAQYGSDAIAGVMNFQLKDDAEGLAFEVRSGQYTQEDDGDLVQVAANLGLPLTDRGFINTTIEYSQQDATSRSVQRPDAQALIDAGNDAVPVPAQIWGSPEYSDNWKGFVNAGIQISDTMEVYGFGNYATKDVLGGFFYRNPVDRGGVFTSGGDPLIFDTTADGSATCPDTLVNANGTPTQALLDDPDCFAFNERFPGGFTPNFGSVNEDWSMVFGTRGEYDLGTENPLYYDFSYSYGFNQTDFLISNTINPSLGPESPTSFELGAYVQRERNFNADFSYPIEIDAFASPLNVGFGFEQQTETFEIKQGEEESWEAGRFADQGGSIGANGFPGFSPAQVGEFSRANWAGYIDLEADVTDRLLLGAAARYEDFDTFGSTDNYKLQARYDFLENADGFVNDLAVRGTWSTGFRAPTPGQVNVTKVSTITLPGTNELIQSGQIPPGNPIAQFLGAQELEPEEAENVSLGLTATLFDEFTLTVDWYRIEVTDRIALGGQIDIDAALAQQLQDAGVPGATDFSTVRFYTNDFDTTTEGVDVVATYALDWGNAGRTNLTAAWNYNRTDVDSFGEDPDNPGEPRVIDRSRIVDLENLNPRNRGIFTANHSWRDFSFLVRASYYDEYVSGGNGGGLGVLGVAPSCNTDGSGNVVTAPENFIDECYGDAWIFDVEASYTYEQRYTFVLGAQNAFDEEAPVDLDTPAGQSAGSLYNTAVPYDLNGRFVYARLFVQL